jgi:hypothetical protein
LKPGETRAVSFSLPPWLLAIRNRDMKPVVKAGRYQAQVGTSPAEIGPRGDFEIR